MSHTTIVHLTEDVAVGAIGPAVRFFHNGDYSGPVTIALKDAEYEWTPERGCEFTLPCEALILVRRGGHPEPADIGHRGRRTARIALRRQTMTEKKLHLCPRCQQRKVFNPLCEWCTKQEAKRAEKHAAWAALPGTVLNVGVDAFFAALPLPDGFTAERFVDQWRPGDPEYPALRIMDAEALAAGGDHAWSTKGIRIEIILRGLSGDYDAGSGHTHFDGYTYDRTGVDDSFHVEFTDTPETLGKTIADQLTRIAASRARQARSERVPGMPGGSWMVTPERKAEIATRLRAGGSHAFTPAGFGTGYRISGRRAPRYGGGALPAETAAFFGVTGPLYYETMDCD